MTEMLRPHQYPIIRGTLEGIYPHEIDMYKPDSIQIVADVANNVREFLKSNNIDPNTVLFAGYNATIGKDQNTEFATDGGGHTHFFGANISLDPPSEGDDEDVFGEKNATNPILYALRGGTLGIYDIGILSAMVKQGALKDSDRPDADAVDIDEFGTVALDGATSDIDKAKIAVLTFNGGEVVVSSSGYLEENSTDQKTQEFEAKEARLNIEEVVADLEVDPSILEKPVVGQIFDMIKALWDETETMENKSAVVARREWLVDIALRTVGDASGFSKREGLSEYLTDRNDEAESERFLAEFGESEASFALASEMPKIAEEFSFSTKIQGFNSDDLSRISFVVIPESAYDDLYQVVGASASGYKSDMKDGSMAIFVKESSYQSAIVEANRASRGFMAYELAHTQRNFTIGDGAPLGHVVNELFAEWAADYTGGYYEEKHMTNLMSAAGLELRRDEMPKLASGEMSMDDFVADLRARYGDLNTLQLLAYTPAGYKNGKGIKPIDIVDGFFEYAITNGVSTMEHARKRLNERYPPSIAVSLLGLADYMMPPKIKTIIENQAASNGG